MWEHPCQRDGMILLTGGIMTLGSRGGGDAHIDMAGMQVGTARGIHGDGDGTLLGMVDGMILGILILGDADTHITVGDMVYMATAIQTMAG